MFGFNYGLVHWDTRSYLNSYCLPITIYFNIKYYLIKIKIKTHWIMLLSLISILKKKLKIVIIDGQDDEMAS